MLCKVTHCAGHVSANTRPHQLCLGDREMGTAMDMILHNVHICMWQLDENFVFEPTLHLKCCFAKVLLTAGLKHVFIAFMLDQRSGIQSFEWVNAIYDFYQ